MALKDKSYEPVASSTTVSERHDRQSEALAVFDSKALDCYNRGGHLLSFSLGVWGSPAQRAVTRALWADWIPGATTAPSGVGRVRNALQGRWADVTSRDFELEIKIKRRRPLRTMERAPGATSWALKLHAVGGSLGNLGGT